MATFWHDNNPDKIDEDDEVHFNLMEDIRCLKESITDHNAECDRLCPDDCVYKTIYKNTRCPDCSKDWKVDIT